MITIYNLQLLHLYCTTPGIALVTRIKSQAFNSKKITEMRTVCSTSKHEIPNGKPRFTALTFSNIQETFNGCG